MLKSYDELRAIDVSKFCSDRDGYLYLNWAKCIDLLHQHGAEKVNFICVQNPKTGGSLFESETVFADKNGNTNRCYEVRIKVEIDDNVYFAQMPVLNGTNPVKDNSMNQARVWAAQTRAFVKCVAINTGLGFNLWLKEENRVFENVPEDAGKPTLAEIKTIKEMCEKHGINLKAWCAQNGTTPEKLTGKEAGIMLRALNEKYGD